MLQVHVVTTTYRPVPLEHHLFAGNELHSASYTLPVLIVIYSIVYRTLGCTYCSGVVVCILS